MPICDYIITLPPSAIAGILTSCGYALREEISLISALEEMGFADVDTSLLDDVSSIEKLAFLAIFCSAQLVLKVSNPFTQENS